MDDIKRTAITKIDWGNRYVLLLVIESCVIQFKVILMPVIPVMHQ